MRLSFLLALTFVIASACGSDDPGGTTTRPSPAPSEAPRRTTAAPTSAPTPAPVAGGLAIINASLIDGTGAALVPNAHIIIGNGRITRIDVSEDQPSLPAEYEVIDAAGRTVMPGLIDGHVHVARPFGDGGPAEEALLPFLQAGFTLLRDVATPTALLKTQKSLADGLVTQGRSPVVVWAGPMVTAAGGYPFSVPRYAAVGEAVGSAEEGAALVDRLADDGATIIKLGLEKGYYEDLGWPVLSLETVRAITTRAHERKMIVTAHVTSIDEVRLALDGGVDNLAHSPLQLIPDDVMQEMLSREIGMVTTATVWGQLREGAAQNARRYADAGGIVSIGTDFGCCNQTAGIAPYLAEMHFLNQAGMTPTQLITAATRNGALLAGLGDETGTVVAGKRADIIILEGNPLLDLNALRSVRTVVLGGQVAYNAE
jgi:imidazolonepropionase-like amidohydrolase